MNAYTLVFGGFLLLGGRLADLLGRRRMFVYGMWLFALASLAGGLAQSDVDADRRPRRAGPRRRADLSGRAGDSHDHVRRGQRAQQGARGLGRGGRLGGAVGVLLGGMLTEWAGWEWVLFVNVPIGIAAALRPRGSSTRAATSSSPSFDIAGAVSVTAGLALLVYTLVDANDAGWGSTQTLALGGLALALLASFVLIERRRRYPLVPFSIFRLRTLRGANVIGLLLGMSLFAMFFFISLYMQQVLGYDPLKAGLAYLPLAGLIIVSAGGASQLVARFGFKPVLIAGMLFTAGGLFWFGQVSAPGGTYVGDVLFPSMLAAVGLGLAFVPVTIAAVTGTKPSEAGLASGLINTSQQVGGAVGLAVLATISTGRTDDVLASGEHSRAVALTEGFQDAFLAGAGIALLGAVLAAVLISSRDSREMAEAARQGEVAPVPA